MIAGLRRIQLKLSEQDIVGLMKQMQVKQRSWECITSVNDVACQPDFAKVMFLFEPSAYLAKDKMLSLAADSGEMRGSHLCI